MPTGKLKTAKESALAGEVRRAIGVGPSDDVSVATPQFERTPDMSSPGAPPVDLESLRSLDKNAMKELGCSTWDEPDADGKVLMLFPGEWYASIPNGTKLVSISGREETFHRGATSDDIRFGCLAFGFRVPVGVP